MALNVKKFMAKFYEAVSPIVNRANAPNFGFEIFDEKIYRDLLNLN